MEYYNTTVEAQKDFAAAFAGYYVVLGYGYKTESEHYGSRRHGQWYCHTSYDTSANAQHQQYELFQVGRRGALKRLHLVTKKLPDNTRFVRMRPDEAKCYSYRYGFGYYLDDDVFFALSETVPETEWKDGPGPIAHHHYI